MFLLSSAILKFTMINNKKTTQEAVYSAVSLVKVSASSPWQGKVICPERLVLETKGVSFPRVGRASVPGRPPVTPLFASSSHTAAERDTGHLLVALSVFPQNSHFDGIAL